VIFSTLSSGSTALTKFVFHRSSICGVELFLMAHTAMQLAASMFSVEIDGVAAGRDEVFPDWYEHDRLGVVLHEPFGAVGATHLIQLAITAFYDAKPARRANARSAFTGPGGVDATAEPVYPEVYLVHVGEDFGDHSALDIWPHRKEVIVHADPRRVLDAINDRAITRLVVPAAPPAEVRHQWKETGAARDRITSCFAYGAAGLVDDADVCIAGLTRATEHNPTRILDPEGTLESARRRQATLPPELDQELASRTRDVRLSERVPQHRDALARAQAARERIRRDGLATETYRRTPVEEALAMLVPQPR
jgi:hypothetical protein